MSQSAFALLHAGVQRAIWEMGWKELRAIQSEAIQTILQTNNSLLITAGTASGKTEAAFLPIISRLADQPSDSIRAIYVGPLKALINDQFIRLERLCERLEIPVHRWHGDVSAAHKQELRRNPRGILLITPESLESNFVNFGTLVPRIYRALDFIVVDELHSFVANVRGMHLLSLLSRLRSVIGRQPTMVGLSATLGDPAVGKRFLCPDTPESVVWLGESGTGREVRFALKLVLKRSENQKVGDATPRLESAQVLDFLRSKPTEALVMADTSPESCTHFEPPLPQNSDRDELDDVADDLLQHFGVSSNLVFVNSRRTAEDLAVRVHDRVASLKWPHDPFLIHHGSVSKDLREEAEATLKSGVPTTVICSSTLEMGIDIGSVRAVGQIDPPWSVASMVQRLGRSGRREGEASIMRLYVREESPHQSSRLTDLLFPDLLRAIALTRLMQQKWLEPADEGRMHLSTLVHQILSHLKQTGGMGAAQLFESLAIKGPFRAITKADFAELLRQLASKGLIEQVPTGEIILAHDGERVTSAHDFYAAFKGTEMFTVRHDRNPIGELPLDAIPPAGQLVVLAGKRWLVQEIESVAKTVWVTPAKGGKTPVFLGSGGELHTRVVQEMRSVLLATDEPLYLDSHARDVLKAARHVATRVGLQNSNVIPSSNGIRWFPWVGSRCQRTLSIIAQLFGLHCETDRLSLLVPVQDKEEFAQFLKTARECPISEKELAGPVTPKTVEKFDEFLPESLLARACAKERLSIEEAKAAASAELKALKSEL